VGRASWRSRERDGGLSGGCTSGFSGTVMDREESGSTQHTVGLNVV
jgi:hypothetical protein